MILVVAVRAAYAWTALSTTQAAAAETMAFAVGGLTYAASRGATVSLLRSLKRSNAARTVNGVQL
ncbi:hypothetical protein FRC12_022093 [Ceratobasidium sp. 428]|nr:hypothetical protein FRC12_022093 [Ceratobasidium sp. 428]